MHHTRMGKDVKTNKQEVKKAGAAGNIEDDEYGRLQPPALFSHWKTKKGGAVWPWEGRCGRSGGAVVLCLEATGGREPEWHRPPWQQYQCHNAL